MTLPPGSEPRPARSGPPGHRVATRVKAFLVAVGALLLGLVVILHLTGVLDPSKLH